MKGSSYVNAEPATTPISNGLAGSGLSVGPPEPLELLPVLALVFSVDPLELPVVVPTLPVDPLKLPIDAPAPPVDPLGLVTPVPLANSPVLREPKLLPVLAGDSDLDPVGGVAGAAGRRRREKMALRLVNLRSAFMRLLLARFTARRAASQCLGCLRRHVLNLFELDASPWPAVARAVAAVRSEVRLIVAVVWEELAAAATLNADETRHSAISSAVSGCAHAQRERGRGVDILVISFGSWAVCVRPLALRARLATGVPLSRACDDVCGRLTLGG